MLYITVSLFFLIASNALEELGENNNQFVNLSQSGDKDIYNRDNIQVNSTVGPKIDTIFSDGKSNASGLKNMDLFKNASTLINKPVSTNKAVAENTDTDNDPVIKATSVDKPSVMDSNLSGFLTQAPQNNGQAKFRECNMTINKSSSAVFRHSIELYHPNFAKFELRFRYVHNTTKGGPYILEPSTSFTEDAVLPYQWVWTYYSPDDFFPYLTWPVDFSILSFGLLGAKSLKPSYLVVEVENENCEVVIGNKDSVLSIGLALRKLTQNYLLPLDKTKFSFTYWCYLSVIPGVKETLAYKLGIYLAYPVEFDRYNCCRTDLSKQDGEGFFIDCNIEQIKKMWQATLIPYILGLAVFAFFPIILFRASASLKSISTNNEEPLHVLLAESLNDDSLRDSDFVFLTGKPPISLTILVAGLCGLSNKHPIAVSRVRRAIFVLFGPILILAEVLTYYCYDYETTMALLDHGCPMGYLSMIGGFEKSQSNFMPILGGPYCLLVGFYVAGCIFLIPPRHLDRIFYDGTLCYSGFGKISSLFLDIESIEHYSHINVSTVTCGYKRLYTQTLAMFYTSVNPVFWFDTLHMQCFRFWSLLTLRSSIIYRIILLSLILPMYVCFCFLELVLCIIYYVIPAINVLCMIATGYFVGMLHFCRRVHSGSHKAYSRVCTNIVIKTVLAIFFTCLFIYFVFSFCTMFICSFAFLAEVFVFSFISIIIFPSTSFGYLFFGGVFLYYIYKMLTVIGENYLELLADAVDVSSQMDHDMLRNNVVDNTLIIDDLAGCQITKLQIRDKIINLTDDQCQAMSEVCGAHPPKVSYRKNVAGIPRDLFNILVNKLLPVHIQITQALLKIFLILALIAVSISIIVARPYGPSEGISEVIHVVFIVVVGALPKLLEVALENKNHGVRKDIYLREIRSLISKYWSERYI